LVSTIIKTKLNAGTRKVLFAKSFNLSNKLLYPPHDDKFKQIPIEHKFVGKD